MRKQDQKRDDGIHWLPGPGGFFRSFSGETTLSCFEIWDKLLS